MTSIKLVFQCPVFYGIFYSCLVQILFWLWLNIDIAKVFLLHILFFSSCSRFYKFSIIHKIKVKCFFVWSKVSVKIQGRLSCDFHGSFTYAVCCFRQMTKYTHHQVIASGAATSLILKSLMKNNIHNLFHYIKMLSIMLLYDHSLANILIKIVTKGLGIFPYF